MSKRKLSKEERARVLAVMDAIMPLKVGDPVRIKHAYGCSCVPNKELLTLGGRSGILTSIEKQREPSSYLVKLTGDRDSFLYGWKLWFDHRCVERRRDGKEKTEADSGAA